MQNEDRRDAMNTAIKWFSLRYEEQVQEGYQSEVLAEVEFCSTIHLMAEDLGATHAEASSWADVAKRHLDRMLQVFEE